VASVGVHTGPTFSFGPVEAYDKNLTCRSGRCPARHDMSVLGPLLERLGDAVASLVSHRMPLEDAPRGYVLFDANEEGCTRVVLAP
jgi:threonine dehydrogenase-like Zn-dependent dehydrogenase